MSNVNVFAKAMENRRPVPAGKYRVEIVAGSAANFTTPKTEGVTFTLRIVSGPHGGREFRVRSLANGPVSMDALIARDMGILAAWADAVGSDPADDLAGAIKNIWVASRNYIVWVTTAHKADRLGTIEPVLVAVSVGPADEI